jgi:hypothetical protein
VPVGDLLLDVNQCLAVVTFEVLKVVLGYSDAQVKTGFVSVATIKNLALEPNNFIVAEATTGFDAFLEWNATSDARRSCAEFAGKARSSNIKNLN